MNVLVVGCRRVGANLARVLDREGHEVSVLAETMADLERVQGFGDEVFGGVTFVGIPVDIENLRTAGIQNVDAVACMTADDNMNLMVAQIAQEMFHVEKVVCRVADPAIKDVFSREFGLNVICPTNLTVESAVESLTQGQQPPAVCFGSTTIGFVFTAVPPQLVGKTAAGVPAEEGRMLVGVLHPGNVLQLLTEDGAPLAETDQLVWAEKLD